MSVFVIAESSPALDARAAELDGAGWAPSLTRMQVTSREDARDAVHAALRGDSLLVDARCTPDVTDDLLEDLARLGTVLVASDESTVRLPVEAWRLLHALAAGHTLTEAARNQHVSLRTANRRLDEAKLAFGVASRAETLRRLAARDRVPRAPD